jgi:hypothetical protein
MITRGEIIMLGIGAGVTGGIIATVMVTVGLDLIAAHANIGWLLLVPAAPVSAIVGWIMGRKLAAKLPNP